MFGPPLPFYGLSGLLIELSKINSNGVQPSCVIYHTVMQQSIISARVKKSPDHYDLEFNIHRREKRERQISS